MSLETQPSHARTEAYEPRARRSDDDASRGLASSMWDNMKLASLPQIAPPTGDVLTFTSPFSDSKVPLTNTRAEYQVPGMSPSGGKLNEVQTVKNVDGGHTDTVTGTSGSKEVSTFDASGKLCSSAPITPTALIPNGK